MRAGKAYAASLGITGLLVVSSIVLLTLVGALMAFDGTRGSDSSLPIDSILVAPPAAASDDADPAPGASVIAAGRRAVGTERGRGGARSRRARRASDAASPALGLAPGAAPAPGGSAPPATPVASPAPIGAGGTVSTLVGEVAPAPGGDLVQNVAERLP